MKFIAAIITSVLLVSAWAGEAPKQEDADGWKTVFLDEFDTFNTNNWRDQILWVNDEDHCYVRDGKYNTREVSDGTLKLRVIDLGEKQPCDALDKTGKKHPDTQYVAGRISSKNRKEFVKGRWTARLRVRESARTECFLPGGCSAPITTSPRSKSPMKRSAGR